MSRPADIERNHARALEIAEMRRQGLLWKQIAHRLGLGNPYRALALGCPRFVTPPTPATEAPPSPEPWWKPDRITRALVRETRAEMERERRRGWSPERGRV